MRPNRRAAQSTTSIRTIAIVVAVCAAVITSLVVARGGDDEASAGPAAAGVAQHGSGHAASGGAYTDTGTQTAPSGPQPVTDVDRTFLVKVRQAGLWEIPAGRLAQTHVENAQGAEFDRIFANLLRASHGKIFATIGEVRAATQNDLIRRHARQANQTVLDHMEVLEDTGLVDNATLRDVEAAVAPK
jgi:hypothetical protein